MGLIILHGRKKKGGKPMELEEAPQRPPHFMLLGILGVKIIPKDTGTYILIPAKNIIMLRYIPTACCLDSWLSFPHAPGEDTSRSISPPEHG